MLRIHHEDTKARSASYERLEEIAAQIVDAGFRVHSTLGPGLMENVYEACFVHELKLRGPGFQTQVHLPVSYKGLKLDAALRLDVLVEERVVVEIKTVEILLPVHKAQLLTYLKLSGHSLGFLLNFNVASFKEGVRRFVL